MESQVIHSQNPKEKKNHLSTDRSGKKKKNEMMLLK